MTKPSPRELVSYDLNEVIAEVREGRPARIPWYGGKDLRITDNTNEGPRFELVPPQGESC